MEIPDDIDAEIDSAIDDLLHITDAAELRDAIYGILMCARAREMEWCATIAEEKQKITVHDDPPKIESRPKWGSSGVKLAAIFRKRIP